MGINKTYRFRDRKGIVKELSAEKILTRIGRGKIQGDEEISDLDDVGEWRKVSSVPKFFDALMMRLHRGADPGESSESGKKKLEEDSGAEAPKPMTISENETRKKTIAKEEERPKTMEGRPKTLEQRPPDEETQHIGDSPEEIDQAAIDELFSESGVPREAISSSVKPLGDSLAQVKSPSDPSTDLIVTPSWQEKAIELENARSNVDVQQRPLDFQRNLKEEEAPRIFAKKRAQERRRKLVLVAVITMVLTLLFQMGGGEETQNEVKQAKSEKVETENLAITKEQVENLILEGDLLYARHTPLDYQQAMIFYGEALRNNEFGDRALSKAAETGARLYPFLNETKKRAMVDRVLKLIQEGRITDPQASAFYRAEALLYLHSGDLEKAKRLLDSAVEADPSNPANALSLGELGIAVNDPGSAKVALQQASQARSTKVLATFLFAKLLFDQRRYQESRELALQALEFNPFYLEAGVLLGALSEVQGRKGEALKLYQSVGKFALLGSQAAAEQVFSRLANLQQEAGMGVAAKESLAIAKYFSKSPDKYVGSAPFSKDLFKKSVFQKEYYLGQANSFSYQKKYEDAVNYLQVVALLDPSNGRLLLKLGETLEKKASHYEDLRRVATYYERAIQKDRGLYLAYVKLGLLETEQYNLDRALGLLQQAESLAPNAAEPYVALGKHFLQRRDFKRSAKFFIRAKKLKPEDSEIHYYVGLLLIQAKKGVAAQASALFEKSYRLDPFNYDALVEWLKIKTLGYQKSFAVKFVRNLIKKEPSNSKLYWVMGEVYSANKEFRRAIQYYHQALDLNKRSSEVRMSLGKALESTGQMDRAIPEYRLASRLDRSNLEGYYRAAQLLVESKEIDESEKVLERLLARSPKYPGGHRLWARIHRVRKKPDRVVASMEQEVANNPANLKFRLELSQMYIDFSQYKKAVDQLREVGNLANGKSPSVIYSKIRAYILLSESYRRMNDFESAEGAVGLAAQIDTDLPEVQRELGFVYEGMHRDREAVEAFKRYLKKEPTAQDASKINQLIKKMEIPQ